MGAPFFTGLSGLTANATGIKTVGNNLANTNTISYKTDNIFFQELVSATNGTLQIGQGVVPLGLQKVWDQGNLQQSQVATNMAVHGTGFFVVGQTGQRGSANFYTRAGNFEVNEEGKLVTSNGFFVKGYPVVDGKVNINSDLDDIIISPGQLLSPRETTLIRVRTNLDSQTLEGDRFSTAVVVHDSLGSSHAVTLMFTKTSDGWDYEVTIPAVDVGGDPSDPPEVLASGQLEFDSNGKLVVPSEDVEDITITGLANGASDLTFTWNLFGKGGESLLTGFSLPSATSESFQDGNGPGSLLRVVVQKNGIIDGIFSNGESQPLAQLALATFINPQGLVKVGDNLYSRTSVSGEPTVGVPGTGGRGDVHGNALEMSNVDIAEEFIKLITFQRGYQANSRLILTSDEITQETIQLKR